jgi:hypothetical protein
VVFLEGVYERGVIFQCTILKCIHHWLYVCTKWPVAANCRANQAATGRAVVITVNTFRVPVAGMNSTLPVPFGFFLVSRLSPGTWRPAGVVNRPRKFFYNTVTTPRSTTTEVTDFTVTVEPVAGNVPGKLQSFTNG